MSAEMTDTLNHYGLQTVEIRGKRLRSQLREIEGTSIISMSLMDEMPHILGNADPLHYAQLLPGVQTNSEYDAGLHIQGCDNSHNYVSLGGAPVYNAAHLLGFFSIFNAGHFSEMSLQKSPVSASFPNRLGGRVDMLTPTWLAAEDSLSVGAVHGELSVGPMSSQGTLRLPVGKRSLLLLSARAAYLNLLYSKWLEVDGDEVKYDFSDYNLSYITQLDDANVLKFEGYWGYDNMKIGQASYGLQGKLKWDNTMAALHWYSRSKDGLNKGGKDWLMEQMVYYSRYANRLNVGEYSFQVGMRSFIFDLGYKGNFSWGRWRMGAEVVRHQLLPQDIGITGNLANYQTDTQHQQSMEASVYLQYCQPLGEKLLMEMGARVSGYHCQKSFYRVMPHLKFNYDLSPSAKLNLNLGIRNQYLFQTGFSSAGLPTEFWFAADQNHRPQYACHAALQGEFWFAEKEYRLSVETYYKWLMNQIENNSNMFDILFSSYSFDGSLLHGKGYNYGLNLLLEKRRGKLTGWLSGSLGRAMRKFDGEQYQGWYPAGHERIYELNAVATYRINRRVSLGSTYVLASGTPYTKVNYAYLMSGNLVTEYGPHNGDRVKPYMRLDLSVSYDFATKGSVRSGINFSLYNVTMHGNDLFYRIKVYDNHVRYNAFKFLMPIMPSINYYCKF
ncbi:TonB-dependent receptor [Segatella copri]|uniref:TonB-dependent receptor plug domain-containing protein n=1 Tax=Segatella copri TaxID=165179 RepID=UPI00294B401E|nr:TonB-dependent receptor [Segatella copri]WOG03732.1 TonB-dependent receptor [Segatella copri]